MVNYDPYFADKVQGQVRAEFVMGSDGAPVYHQDGTRQHYRIKLKLDTQNPSVRKVDYKLHPSYYNPYRDSADRESGFAIELTSYGDYPFVVEVIVGTELARQELLLSELLEETYGAVSDARVQKALNDIRSN